MLRPSSFQGQRSREHLGSSHRSTHTYPLDLVRSVSAGAAVFLIPFLFWEVVPCGREYREC